MEKTKPSETSVSYHVTIRCHISKDSELSSLMLVQFFSEKEILQCSEHVHKQMSMLLIYIYSNLKKQA
jgi:hypothetical protein